MFKVSKFLAFATGFAGFFISAIPLIINSTPLYWIEILWNLLFAAYNYHTTNINLSQMTHFYIICLYLKLKLRNANKCITKSFYRKYKMTIRKMKKILKSLNSIISEINTYNNDFWSKQLMIVLMLGTIVFDFLFFESLFGKMSLFIKILVLWFSFNVSLIDNSHKYRFFSNF